MIVGLLALVAVVLTAPRPALAAAPISEIHGVPAGWSNSDVSITFTTNKDSTAQIDAGSPNLGATPGAKVMYSLTGSPTPDHTYWSLGLIAPIVVGSPPIAISAEGSTLLSYQAIGYCG